MATKLSTTDIMQIGRSLFASGFFGLENEDQAIALILRGQELDIPPVASLMRGTSFIAQFSPINANVEKTNAQRISDLLNELGITDPKQRKAIATDHLVGRKAADLTPEELEEVLDAIRQAYAQEEEAADDVEAVVVEDDAEPVETPETPEAAADTPDEDETIDARAAISAALDGAGITDVDCRQVLVKKQLLAVRRRKVEMLTPEELATVIEGIAASAAA